MKNELAFDTFEDAMTVAKILIKNDYIVMLSKEESLIILNYEWSPHGNRNYVVFGLVDDIAK